jgi:uncharacterized protein (DUF608 family)
MNTTQALYLNPFWIWGIFKTMILNWSHEMFLLFNTCQFTSFLQQPDSKTGKHRKAFATMDFDMEYGGQFSFSDRDSA